MINTKVLFDYDKSFLSKDTKYIAGMDEVGRGPLAGPVVTACVIMPYDENSMIDGVFDSKKVSKKNREKLYALICERAIAYSISVVDVNVNDNIKPLNTNKKVLQLF